MKLRFFRTRTEISSENNERCFITCYTQTQTYALIFQKKNSIILCFDCVTQVNHSQRSMIIVMNVTFIRCDIFIKGLTFYTVETQINIHRNERRSSSIRAFHFFKLRRHHILHSSECTVINAQWTSPSHRTEPVQISWMSDKNKLSSSG